MCVRESDNPLRWRHNGCDSVSNHQPQDCLLNRLFRHKSKKTSKLRVTALYVGNSPGTGELPTQRASYAENVSIWWRHMNDRLFGNKLLSELTLLSLGRDNVEHSLNHRTNICRYDALSLNEWRPSMVIYRVEIHRYFTRCIMISWPFSMCCAWDIKLQVSVVVTKT